MAVSLFVGEDNKFLNVEAGARVAFNWTSTSSVSNGSATSKTVGYVLSDEDLGDNFSVDVVEDVRFGTIGFRTVAGISSCPPEENTQSRFIPRITVEDPVKHDIAENQQGVYQLIIADESETTSSLEDPLYFISLDASSNQEGAIVKIAGHNLSSSPYEIEIPSKSSITLPVTLERGPLAHDYERVRIVIVPECESDEDDYDDALISAFF